VAQERCARPGFGDELGARTGSSRGRRLAHARRDDAALLLPRLFHVEHSAGRLEPDHHVPW
jgi:hypothetical protein